MKMKTKIERIHDPNSRKQRSKRPKWNDRFHIENNHNINHNSMPNAATVPQIYKSLNKAPTHNHRKNVPFYGYNTSVPPVDPITGRKKWGVKPNYSSNYSTKHKRSRGKWSQQGKTSNSNSCSASQNINTENESNSVNILTVHSETNCNSSHASIDSQQYTTTGNGWQQNKINDQSIKHIESTTKTATQNHANEKMTKKKLRSISHHEKLLQKENKKKQFAVMFANMFRSILNENGDTAKTNTTTKIGNEEENKSSIEHDQELNDNHKSITSSQSLDTNTNREEKDEQSDQNSVAISTASNKTVMKTKKAQHDNNNDFETMSESDEYYSDSFGMY